MLKEILIRYPVAQKLIKQIITLYNQIEIVAAAFDCFAKRERVFFRRGPR